MRTIPRNTEVTPIIVALAQVLQPTTYVEIGVKRGYTFNQVAPFAKRAVAVDLADVSSFIQPLLHVEIHKMSSEEFAREWIGPIDLLFIDADHRRDAVLRDVKALLPFVTMGTGLILLHDTHPGREELIDDGYCSDAWEAADWLHKKGDTLFGSRDLEVVTIPSIFGMTIIRNRGKHHLAWRTEEWLNRIGKSEEEG